MVTLKMLQEDINTLLKRSPALGDWPVEDKENSGFYITRIDYNKETDELFFECAEE